MTEATLVISSKNYSSWSLRGWLLARMSGLKFQERVISLDNSSARAEILLLSPSILVPCLIHDGHSVWDTLAIGEYLNEIKPAGRGLLPEDSSARSHSRSICGEMHSGFTGLRSALPMNIKRHYTGFKVWAGALADIERVTDIWRDCQSKYGGPYLFGATPTMADAMYAPVATRFHTYDVKLDKVCADYCATILALPDMAEWIEAAKSEPDELPELDAEF
ncbi:glutathione S-transferase [Skermanella stibiiresistens SB22]|uniref:Glutathione S-transferase n=1 Tax=Skermanella stibiiresistens SB22 TaxID=1385369 RepID=W9H358_9PROT|nr:glutathione S-transferase family protein [Skermanella stibiiresistens]EWY39231.1 glutathione S-transferase [Skermanella stibiiresistens SB22]